MSLQASAGVKPGSPHATPSTTSKHARQLPFTSGTPVSRLPEQAMVNSPAHSLQRQTASCSQTNQGLHHVSSDSRGLSYSEEAVFHSPTASEAIHRDPNSPTLSLPKQAPAESGASGPLQKQCHSPALSLPDQATCHSPDHMMFISHDATGHLEQSEVNPPQQGMNMEDETAAEEHGLEAYALSDLWKIFVQQMGQVCLLLFVCLPWCVDACTACLLQHVQPISFAMLLNKCFGLVFWAQLPP